MIYLNYETLTLKIIAFLVYYSYHKDILWNRSILFYARLAVLDKSGLVNYLFIWSNKNRQCYYKNRELLMNTLTEIKVTMKGMMA